jgi:phage terminase large subunit
MKQTKIYITQKSFNTKKEFDNYTWAKDKNGNILDTPIDAFCHILD